MQAIIKATKVEILPVFTVALSLAVLFIYCLYIHGEYS